MHYLRKSGRDISCLSYNGSRKVCTNKLVPAVIIISAVSQRPALQR